MLVEQPAFGALRAAQRVAMMQPPGSPVARKQREKALELAQAEGLVHGAYAFRIVPTQLVGEGLLSLGEHTLCAPWLVPEQGTLTGLAVGAATLGPALERRVGELFAEKKAGLALGLNQLGIEMLMATSMGMKARLAAVTRKQGLSVSGELRPGDPGLALDAHAGILAALDTPSVPVKISSGQLLTPLKSTTVVFGVGVDLPEATWSRCDSCKSRDKCMHARLMAAA